MKNNKSYKELLKLDNPIISNILFHPRKDKTSEELNEKNELILVDNKVKVGCRLHLNNKLDPNIIFFHGNAEIVSEYDEFARTSLITTE